MLATEQPYPQFFDLNGDPLDNGNVYYGVANQDPLTNPLGVYWDSAGTIPVSQPVKTIAGVQYRSGTPAVVYAPAAYSVLVQDKRGRTIYYAADSSQFSNSDVLQSQIQAVSTALAGTASSITGASLIGFNPTQNYVQFGNLAGKLRNYRDSTDKGAVSNGASYATLALQQLMLDAWSALYYNSQTWTGAQTGGAMPVVSVTPGRYKLDDTLTLATSCALRGLAHPANTVSHTRLVMDSTTTVPGGGPGDNRNRPIIKFNRGTANGAALANSACTIAISDMEFLYVTMGNDFNIPLGGAGIPLKGYPLGGSLFIDVDHADSRVENVCFQHGPAAVRGLNVPKTTTTRGDGFPGNSGISMFFKGCEFDAAEVQLWFTNCHLDLEFDNCAFFGGGSFFENCTGRVVFHSNCRFYGGAYIDASSTSNSFDEFVFNARVDQSTIKPSLTVYGAKFLDVSASFRSASGLSSIVAVACRGGSINPVLQDSGYNANPGTGPDDFTAAVKLVGCALTVNATISDITAGGAWNGFGVLSVDGTSAPAYGTALTSSNVIKSVIVRTAYNGASYNGQNREVNLSGGDVVIERFQSGRPKEIASSVGLNLRGNTLVQTSLLASASSNSLASLIPESGVYLVTVETQYQTDLAAINCATFMVYRRFTNGIVVQTLALSNPATISGVISLTTTTLNYTYTAGTSYYLTIRMNKVADNGME